MFFCHQKESRTKIVAADFPEDFTDEAFQATD